VHPVLALGLAAVLAVAAAPVYRKAGLRADEALLATALAFGGMALAILATARHFRAPKAEGTREARLAVTLSSVVLAVLALGLAPVAAVKRDEPVPGTGRLPPLPGPIGRGALSPLRPAGTAETATRPRPPDPLPPIEELLLPLPRLVPPPAALSPVACSALPRPAPGAAFAAIVADGGGALASASLSRGTPARMGDPDDDRLGSGPDEASRVTAIAIEPGEGAIFLVAVLRTPTILAFSGAVERLSEVVLDGGYPAGKAQTKGVAPLVGATGLPRGKPVFPVGADCLAGLAISGARTGRADIGGRLAAAFGRRPDILAMESGPLPDIGIPSAKRVDPGSAPDTGAFASDPLARIRDDLRVRTPAGFREVADHDLQAAGTIVRHGRWSDLSGLAGMRETGAVTFVEDPVDGHLAEIRVRRTAPFPYPPGRGMRLALGRAAIVFDKGAAPSGYRWDGICTLAEGGDVLLSGRTACLWARPGGRTPPGPVRGEPTVPRHAGAEETAQEAPTGRDAAASSAGPATPSPVAPLPPQPAGGFLIRPPPAEGSPTD